MRGRPAFIVVDDKGNDFFFAGVTTPRAPVLTISPRP